MQSVGKQNRTARGLAPDALALWKEYRRSGDRAVRDRLIFTLTPMVRYIVYRKVREIPAQYDVEDFLACGLEALMRSIERYDPEKGATLEQFAWTRVHGAVLDELRRHDWAPRSLRRAERQVNDARSRFVAANERQPTRQELADALEITPRELSATLDELALSEVSSLNQSVSSDGEDPIERIDTLRSEDPRGDPVASAERRELSERFRGAFKQLSARERQVAVLLYIEGWTLREIGARLGVSESRVCQINTELRRHLREELAAA